MEELLSLKWNNHKNCFLQLLSLLRKKNAYADVTLACDGKFYNVHQMVLSACSDYFSDIFDNISCPKPVVVLKDMSASNLESLLDYMYLGEVSVKQADLSSLIQAAECLKLKGLAVPDTESTEKSDKKRVLQSSPKMRKRLRKSNRSESPPKESKTQADSVIYEDSSVQSPINLEPISLPSALKKEDSCDNITIKEESLTQQEIFSDSWDVNADVNNDPMSFDLSQDNIEEHSQFEDMHQTFTSDTFNERDNSNCETSNFDTSLPSSSQQYGNDTVNSAICSVETCCLTCNKQFYLPSELKRHIRIHTGEKPFLCPHCPYKSTQSCNLKKHIQYKHT